LKSQATRSGRPAGSREARLAVIGSTGRRAFCRSPDLDPEVAGEAWGVLGVLHRYEGQAIEAFLAYRRAGGENHQPGARLATAVAQGIASGETAAVASQLAELGGRPDLPAYLQALVPVLQQIVQGSRDPALASAPGLIPMDAVEVQLLLEKLG
jgi:hypothetical protein